MYDYYYAIDDRLLPELPPQHTIDLVTEGEELPPVEGEAEAPGFPRLEEMFKRALKQ